MRSKFYKGSAPVCQNYLVNISAFVLVTFFLNGCFCNGKKIRLWHIQGEGLEEIKTKELPYDDQLENSLSFKGR